MEQAWRCLLEAEDSRRRPIVFGKDCIQLAVAIQVDGYQSVRELKVQVSLDAMFQPQVVDQVGRFFEPRQARISHMTLGDQDAARSSE